MYEYQVEALVEQDKCATTIYSLLGSIPRRSRRHSRESGNPEQ
jgi:hypothetical protein